MPSARFWAKRIFNEKKQRFFSKRVGEKKRPKKTITPLTFFPGFSFRRFFFWEKHPKKTLNSNKKKSNKF